MEIEGKRKANIIKYLTMLAQGDAVDRWMLYGMTVSLVFEAARIARAADVPEEAFLRVVTRAWIAGEEPRLGVKGLCDEGTGQI